MRQSLKFTAAFLLIILIRLIPFRPANVEPMMGTIMPFGSKFNALSTVVLTMASMVIYDLLTNYGTWTWETAITYGLIAGAAAYYFKKITPSRTHYVAFAAVATLVYDFITGPFLPTVLHHGNFMALTIAQIPFTASHLAGNVVFAIILSPIIQKYVVENPAWELSFSTDRKLKAQA